MERLKGLVKKVEDAGSLGKDIVKEFKKNKIKIDHIGTARFRVYSDDLSKVQKVMKQVVGFPYKSAWNYKKEKDYFLVWTEL